MPKKPLTFSETLVGRRLPPPPKHLDALMADFVKDRATSEFCGRMAPLHTFLKPAHLKARRSGWIQFNGLSFGKGAEIYFLTERGQPVALECFDRVARIEADRNAWGRDCSEAFHRRAEEGKQIEASE